MPVKKPKARVFLSCGQRPEEEEIMQQVKDCLHKLGFDTYVAKNIRSVKGLKENILTALENSEYFLFIDFKR